MTLVTRRPTGLPSWPMILLAGREGAGKSYGAATATASSLIERSFWIGIGEDDPDEYGAIPNADFEIVEHLGTVADITRAIRDVAVVPKADKPYLLIVDSTTKMWDLVVDNAQGLANQRARGRKNAGGDYAISPDLWNVAAGQWKAFMDAIRLHRGPSILTARLDEVMVMNDEGQPTKDKRWKVQAHKSLVYDAGFVVEMHERGKYLITKAKSLRMQIEKPTEADGFTVEGAWERLGLTEGPAGERNFQDIVSDDPSVEAAVVMWRERAKEQTSRDSLTQVWKDARSAQVADEVLDAIREVAAAFQEEQPMVSVPRQGSTKRQWIREANGKESSVEVRELMQEAIAAGALAQIVEELEAIANKLPDPAASEPTAIEGWAVAEIPTESENWAPGPDGAPPVDGDEHGDRPAALDDAFETEI